jgi:light-regulated signal transduction histidine kinase (bacteriophytochrome)
MLGYDPATLVGEMFWEFIDVQYHELVKENVRKGVSAIYEVELIHIDGRRVPAEVMGKSIMWKGQRVRAASLRDITERKLAEEVLQRHTTELEIVNKELESFIYSVSHDLRAPLRAISGFSSILAANAADRLNEKEKDYVERICGGTARMSQLIDDLLDLSRISQTEMQCERADLGKMAATVIAGLRDADPVRNVAVNTQAGLIAEADPRMIELAVSNLLENAWKFTSKKEKALIEFGTVNHPSYSPPESGGEQGRTVYFIRDNGAGFDPAYKDKMFLPFHRLHTRDEFEGTGIGLAIVNRIVHRHGGKLWAEGQVGKGATIYFTLG